MNIGGKFDAGRQVQVRDVNERIGASFRLCVRRGDDVVQMLYRALTGQTCRVNRPARPAMVIRRDCSKPHVMRAGDSRAICFDRCERDEDAMVGFATICDRLANGAEQASAKSPGAKSTRG